MHISKHKNTMRDLHDPNNPDYEKESELTREIIFEKLTDEEICFLEDEEEYKENVLKRRTARLIAIKAKINELIEVLEQTEQTYTVNKLKSILEL